MLASQGTVGLLPVDLLTTAAHRNGDARDADGQNEGGRMSTLPAGLLNGCRHRRSDTYPAILPRETPSRRRPEHSISIRDSAPLGRADPSAPTTIRLSGEIDIFTSPDLREDLLDVLRYSRNMLVLDLSGVAACDFSGLGVLVGIQRRAKTMGITLSLTAARPYLSRLLHVTGLDRTIPMLAAEMPAATRQAEALAAQEARRGRERAGDPPRKDEGEHRTGPYATAQKLLIRVDA
ncbi:STAS domain-containing protein [Microbispora sp. NPDC049633]|uniref:STAS domain-containing protein n=1 Tax=Microbispora sp. NPDC049633 TaxID=3154355 RepID=UPI00341FBB59